MLFYIDFFISFLFFFFFNDTATTEIYTLSLHDALPIALDDHARFQAIPGIGKKTAERIVLELRSEEHTSELQSRQYLVCRLLLEKKKKKEKGRQDLKKKKKNNKKK